MLVHLIVWDCLWEQTVSERVSDLPKATQLSLAPKPHEGRGFLFSTA